MTVVHPLVPGFAALAETPQFAELLSRCFHPVVLLGRACKSENKTVNNSRKSEADGNGRSATRLKTVGSRISPSADANPRVELSPSILPGDGRAPTGELLSGRLTGGTPWALHAMFTRARTELCSPLKV
eukprot:CAMPEP_0117683988 /NCGR_PEP_ID=MMETSP0804-20121206/20787_1 /TAXON_ID=1074897 /ORGANISM="Tetraselmis astigmatica, Strain CCMP880" /LENGTH=128 /DNA_ID=CAMNT_0005494805 /DNA_START=259 /DNA_END=645 /DNA_ORIENTATION=+